MAIKTVFRTPKQGAIVSIELGGIIAASSRIPMLNSHPFTPFQTKQTKKVREVRTSFQKGDKTKTNTQNQEDLLKQPLTDHFKQFFLRDGFLSHFKIVFKHF